MESLFPPELEPYAKIQRCITDLSDDSLDSAVDLITTSSALLEKCYVDFVIKELFLVVPLKHKAWLIYTKLVARLIRAGLDVPQFRDFKTTLLNYFFATDDEWEMHNKTTILHFLRLCFQEKVFSLNEIINRLTGLSTTAPQQYFLSVCYFAPEVSVASPGVFEDLLLTIRKMEVTDDQTATMTMTMLPPDKVKSVKRIKDPIFQDYVNQFSSLCANNFEKLIPLLETGCELRSVEYDIYMNDVESLKTKVGKTYNVQRRVEPNPFHPAMFIQWRPTLLEMAAFYGSFDCFNYLLKRNARTSFISLMATAGGNFQILQKVKELDVPFENCLRIAAAFRNFKVMDWIIENCSTEFKLSKEINYCWARGAFTNYLPMLEYCLQKGADPNFSDENDQTGLHLAVEKENKEALLFILSRPKIQYRKKNVYGWNPHSMTKNKEILQILANAEEQHKIEKEALKQRKQRMIK